MSHELRTPLNAILGFSGLLHDTPGVPKEQQKDLDIIKRAGEHLLSLIDDVLDMAKVETGSTSVENETFNLRELLGATIDMMRVRAKEKNLELLLDA
jgi:signal transduction histidine kinase